MSLYYVGKGILSIQALPGTMMALIGACRVVVSFAGNFPRRGVLRSIIAYLSPRICFSPGAGVLPMEQDMVAFAPFWSKVAGFELDPKAFLLFVGCGKVASVLGMVSAVFSHRVLFSRRGVV